MPEPITTPATPQAGGTGDPQPQAGNSQVQATSETPNQTVSIEELQRQIADLRKENASHRKKNKDAEDAAALAEQKRLAEQGEFKQLADKHAARILELEPISQSYSKLAEQINANIEAEIKDWPTEVKALVPGIETAVEQRLEQMNRLRPLLEKLQTTARGSQPGNRPNPAQASPQATKQALLEANRASFQKQRGYNI